MSDSDSGTLTTASRSLRNQACAWHSRLQRALLAVENQHRRELHLPPHNSDAIVDMPQGPKASMLLLNLKTWCERYHVTPEFVLEFLTRWYRNARRWEDDPHHDAISLGLPAGLVTSTAARLRLEEHVRRTFPGGENMRPKRF